MGPERENVDEAPACIPSGDSMLLIRMSTEPLRDSHHSWIALCDAGPGDRDVGPGPRRQFAAAASDYQRRKILVVEDDVEICAMLRFALEGQGLEVESAADGLSALQKVRQETPDLVILDLNMPRMGGEDFLYAWRTGVEAPGVPVIVVTAGSQSLRPQDLGVEAFFSKPFNIDHLLHCVNELLAFDTTPRAPTESDPRNAEMAGVVDDLASAISALLISAEQLADAQELPECLRPIATTGLDAAQRASVLARRLNRLINAAPKDRGI